MNTDKDTKEHNAIKNFNGYNSSTPLKIECFTNWKGHKLFEWIQGCHNSSWNLKI